MHISSTLNDPLNIQILSLVTYISPQLVNFAWNHFILSFSAQTNSNQVNLVIYESW